MTAFDFCFENVCVANLEFSHLLFKDITFLNTMHKLSIYRMTDEAETARVKGSEKQAKSHIRSEI